MSVGLRPFQAVQSITTSSEQLIWSQSLCILAYLSHLWSWENYSEPVSGMEGPSESGQCQEFPEAILSCLLSCLRNFIEGGNVLQEAGGLQVQALPCLKI